MKTIVMIQDSVDSRVIVTQDEDGENERCLHVAKNYSDESCQALVDGINKGFDQGYAQGVINGRELAQQEIRKALGL
jgi:flagellar biosynthesis/type III secretory pathway protein FliH